MTGKRGKVAAALLILALALSVAASAGAQGNSPDWAKLGSLPAGARLLAVDPTNAYMLYALGSDGISASTDSGASWSTCNRDARSLTVAAPGPSQTGTLALYTTTPGGPRASEDGCKTWKDLPVASILPSAGHVRTVIPYPGNRQVLYAAMDGLGGLYRTTDGGSSWQGASGGIPAGAWVTALTADPGKPDHLYVGVRYARDYHPPAYLYRSTDGGLTWRSDSLGMHLLPNNGGYISGLAWSGPTLFAATSSDGLYSSGDEGDSWTQATLPRRTREGEEVSLPGAPTIPRMPLKLYSLASTAEGALVVSTSEGAYQSSDGARSWQHFGPDGTTGDGLLLAVDPSTGRALLAGDNQAIWGYKMPTGAVVLPTATQAAVAQVPPTPPPPAYLPTNTPLPPTPVPATATPQPQPSPTAVIANGSLPTDKADPLDPSYSDYFPQTGHNIKYGFRDFWLNNGGLAAFGYPLTEEFTENGTDVQYFERARLEYVDGSVVRGRLGSELTAGQFYQTVRFFPSTDTDVYFGPTQHSVSGPFLRFWQKGGGIEAFGYPLSEDLKMDDGSEVQWFERARLEWHAAHQTEGEPMLIELGNIGTEALKKRGWLK